MWVTHPAALTVGAKWASLIAFLAAVSFRGNQSFFLNTDTALLFHFHTSEMQTYVFVFARLWSPRKDSSITWDTRMNNPEVRELQGSCYHGRWSLAHGDSWCPRRSFLCIIDEKWKQKHPSRFNYDPTEIHTQIPWWMLSSFLSSHCRERWLISWFRFRKRAESPKITFLPWQNVLMWT